MLFATGLDPTVDRVRAEPRPRQSEAAWLLALGLDSASCGA